MKNKSTLRLEILEKRNQLSPKDIQEKSDIICNKVIASPQFKLADTILVYMPIKSEVLTIPLIKHAWSLNKCVGLPKTQGEKMEFYEVYNFNDLTLGKFNVLEPLPTRLIETQNALLIMPGVVFDKQKNRIGYGKGFYDRYLKQYPKFETMALAFECQIVDKIMSESHDILPDYLITERQIIK